VKDRLTHPVIALRSIPAFIFLAKAWTQFHIFYIDKRIIASTRSAFFSPGNTVVPICMFFGKMSCFFATGVTTLSKKKIFFACTGNHRFFSTLLADMFDVWRAGVLINSHFNRAKLLSQGWHYCFAGCFFFITSLGLSVDKDGR